MARKEARQIAMQLIYQYEMGGDGIASTIEETIEGPSLTTSDREYIDQVVLGAVERAQDLDARIAAHAQGWTLERIARVDLAILRLALFEMFYREDVPTGVVRATVHSDEHADVVISIAPSELYVGRSMADLSEEELDELRSIAGEQYENPTFATETSPEGNLYLFVSSNDESDIDSLFTIYEGYFVELIQYHDDYSEQTDADDDFARSLLYGIEFSTDESQAE